MRCGRSERARIRSAASTFPASPRRFFSALPRKPVSTRSCCRCPRTPRFLRTPTGTIAWPRLFQAPGRLATAIASTKARSRRFRRAASTPSPAEGVISRGQEPSPSWSRSRALVPQIRGTPKPRPKRRQTGSSTYSAPAIGAAWGDRWRVKIEAAASGLAEPFRNLQLVAPPGRGCSGATSLATWDLIARNLCCRGGDL